MLKEMSISKTETEMNSVIVLNSLPKFCDSIKPFASFSMRIKLPTRYFTRIHQRVIVESTRETYLITYYFSYICRLLLLNICVHRLAIIIKIMFLKTMLMSTKKIHILLSCTLYHIII